MTFSKKRLILASGSPRRRELLGLTGLAFELTVVDRDETPRPGELPTAYAVRMSQDKAQAALQIIDGEALVLASDTTVADGSIILGKPADPDEARVMLRQLRGRTHQVITAITVIETSTGRSVTEAAITDVPMRCYTDAEIEAYIASGDPFDKAGSYAIQNTNFHPAAFLRGCYANVVGLPLCHLVRVLSAFGVQPYTDVPLLCQRAHAYTCTVFGEILAGG
jgi:septum formation protein